MFPACRTTDEGVAMPTFARTPPDVAGFLEERWACQSALHDCLTRREARTPFCDYMVGQLSPLARQSIEPMALHGEGGTSRGLQRFRSDGPWAAEQRRGHEHPLVAEAMGAPAGVLRVDETGFGKKGKASVGVARQDWGTLGQVENCQGGVFASDASPQGYARVAQRFCVPEAWGTEAYATRRPRCHGPTALTWQRQPQGAAAMGQALAHAGLLLFTALVAACPRGKRPDVGDAIERGVGGTAFVALPVDTRCWLQAPRPLAKTYAYQGAVRSKRVVGAGPPEPCPVRAMAASLPAALGSADGLGTDAGADPLGVCPPAHHAL